MSHKIRRGDKNNLLDVTRTYTIYVDFFKIDKTYDREKDTIKLESDDGEYSQTLNFAKDGEVVDNRWIKMTFRRVKAKKPYTCTMCLHLQAPASSQTPQENQPDSDLDNDFDALVEDLHAEKISAEQGGQSASQSAGTKGSSAAGAEPASSPPTSDASPQQGEGKSIETVLFRHLPLEDCHFNRPNKLSEEFTDDQKEHDWGGIDELQPDPDMSMDSLPYAEVTEESSENEEEIPELECLTLEAEMALTDSESTGEETEGAGSENVEPDN